MPQRLTTPLIYEISTWVWLNSLSGKYNRPIDLSSVPQAEWDYIRGFGFNTVWLMGVWTRSPIGTSIAGSIPALIREYRRALPDFTPEDISGSPYSIRDYQVDPHLGGHDGLATARAELRARGLKLILDFVPNHVAPDHPWVGLHPEFLVRGNPAEVSVHPELYFERRGQFFAHGHDLYFPPWTDTVQLNAFNPGLREAVSQTLINIASQCDGVRCDMAMLLLTDIFERTWGQLAGDPLPMEYWTDVIGRVRTERPDFIFLAEAYWDLEYALQQLGFDYCYDKRLYDRLCHSDAASVRAHLIGDLTYQRKLVRFLENHDEPRAATLAQPRLRAAAAVIATLPGAQLYHDGQLTGRRVKLPIQLRRRPDESGNEDLEEFYRAILKIGKQFGQPESQWQLSEAENQHNVLAWRWILGNTVHLVLINFGNDRTWLQTSERNIELEPWEFQLLEVSGTGNRSK